MNLPNSMGMTQYGQRYRVRRDPSFHDLWCIIDREYLDYFSQKFADGPIYSSSIWQLGRIIQAGVTVHFDDFDDAIAFVKLIEKSNYINR